MKTLDNGFEEQIERMNAERPVLEAVFARVSDSADWRAPIRAYCRVSETEIVARAIMFFTATKAEFYATHSKDWRFVEADGYRAGPAGDH